MVYETIVIAILSTNTKGNNSKLGTSGLGSLFKRYFNIYILKQAVTENLLQILKQNDKALFTYPVGICPTVSIL